MIRTHSSPGAVHLHVGRIVVDASGADAFGDTHALAEAIRLRLDDPFGQPHGDSLGVRIADALRPQFDEAIQRSSGGQHDVR